MDELPIHPPPATNPQRQRSNTHRLESTYCGARRDRSYFAWALASRAISCRFTCRAACRRLRAKPGLWGCGGGSELVWFFEKTKLRRGAASLDVCVRWGVSVMCVRVAHLYLFLATYLRGDKGGCGPWSTPSISSPQQAEKGLIGGGAVPVPRTGAAGMVIGGLLPPTALLQVEGGRCCGGFCGGRYSLVKLTGVKVHSATSLAARSFASATARTVAWVGWC